MSEFENKAVEAIMRRFFNSVITTSTWFVNYIERKHPGEETEAIQQIREKIKELRDMTEHL